LAAQQEMQQANTPGLCNPQVFKGGVAGGVGGLGRQCQQCARRKKRAEKKRVLKNECVRRVKKGKQFN